MVVKEEPKMCINLKDVLKERHGMVTYICYSKGTKGYELVQELRSKGADVGKVVEKLLEMAEVKE